MLKPLFYAFTLLVAATAAATNTCNKACGYVNDHYKQCILGECAHARFKSCLCTKRFLVNYDRCSSGLICEWDGRPETLNQPCPAIACVPPGSFDGGFDAKAFCSSNTCTANVTSTVMATPITTA
ncbi:hypothetical protein CPB86DRAFT_789777, partial [Serendipita vermifera]